MTKWARTHENHHPQCMSTRPRSATTSRSSSARSRSRRCANGRSRLNLAQSRTMFINVSVKRHQCDLCFRWASTPATSTTWLRPAAPSTSSPRMGWAPSRPSISTADSILPTRGTSFALGKDNWIYSADLVSAALLKYQQMKSEQKFISGVRETCAEFASPKQILRISRQLARWPVRVRTLDKPSLEGCHHAVGELRKHYCHLLDD